jgi:lamin tail-like protein
MRPLLALLVLAVLSLTSIPAASAAGGVQIKEIYYNSPGSDTGSNKSLNAEWVLLKNTAAKGISLKGWTLRDASSHVYHFPSTYKLGAGHSVKVHTGHGSNTSTNLYWGSSSYIWNNDKDTATLKRSNGTVADKCSYSNSSANYVFC